MFPERNVMHDWPLWEVGRVVALAATELLDDEWEDVIRKVGQCDTGTTHRSEDTGVVGDKLSY